jgi:outer membrane protein TolC
MRACLFVLLLVFCALFAAAQEEPAPAAPEAVPAAETETDPPAKEAPPAVTEAIPAAGPPVNLEVKPSAADEEIELTIDDCILMAVLFNRSVQDSYLTLRKTDDDQAIDRADFLPRLDLEYDYDYTNYDSSSINSIDREGSLVYKQRIWELGKENGAYVSTRGIIRSRLYSLRDTLADAVSDVRRDFFSILLKQQQIIERRLLLKEFEGNLIRARAKYAKGQILEIDVFAVELNVLNEQLRINELERTILKRKMDLRYRLGCRIPLAFRLKGLHVPLKMAEKDAMHMAFDRSFLLTRLREEINEQEREIGEKVWEYLPQLTFQVGYDNYYSSVAVDLAQSGHVWGVDVEAEGFWQPSNSREATYTDKDMNDYYGSFQIRMPLFDGFVKRHENSQDRKQLRILNVNLRDSENDLERDVLKDYQDYYEHLERLEIVKRRVEIAKRRLSINEQLKEFGKIDDNQLENFRNSFFSQQDSLFAEQDALINAEEDIRKYIFDPAPFQFRKCAVEYLLPNNRP